MMSINFACVCLLAATVFADVYMHNPRGSNNRLQEANAERTNGNRLFDSQNNNRGGYNVGDRTDAAHDTNNPEFDNPDDVFDYTDTASNKQYQMAYYEESELVIEWTNQHSCGGNEEEDPQKVNCNIVIQYVCDHDDPTGDIAMTVALRNGGSTDDVNEPNSYAEASDTATDGTTGRHESRGWYYECKKRERNGGLLLLDQKLNGNAARYTRQNPNGNRNGLECPEERDYYPYWWPSPWVDVAYLTDHIEQICPIVQAGSQNNNEVYKCSGLVEQDQDTYINEEECVDNGGTWTTFEKDVAAPECAQAPWARTNHLGNGRDGQAQNYTWTLPAFDDIDGTTYGNTYQSKKCVLRLRYNISTDDYDPWNTNVSHNYEVGVEQNPTVDIGVESRQGLQLAINTNQFGRTFQDRSHTFYVTKRPNAFAAKKIYNLNVRGKRGNIVQTFPSVEYDFVPNRLTVDEGDLYHLQWTGSNTHNNGGNGGDGQAGDDGQGQGGTDRNNFVAMDEYGANFPIPLDKTEFDSINIVKQSVCYDLQGAAITPWEDCAVILATTGYGRTTADDFTDMSNQLNNAPASLIGGVVLETSAGTYKYMSSRNNNFSNRGQKGWLIVQ